MKTLIILLLLASPAWAGTQLTKLSQTMTIIDMNKQEHFMHYVQGIILEKVILDEEITNLRNAVDFNNHAFAMDYALKIQRRLHMEVAGSPVDITQVDDALNNLIDKASQKQPFKKEVEMLDKIIEQIREAKRSSQVALSKEEIADMARQAEEVLTGAMVFTSSEVIE